MYLIFWKTSGFKQQIVRLDFLISLLLYKNLIKRGGFPVRTTIFFLRIEFSFLINDTKVSNWLNNL